MARRFGKHEREYLFKRERGRCYWCKSKLNRGADDFNRDPFRFTVDHKKPVSKGGKTSFKNCVAACKGCNSSRGPGRWYELPEHRREIAQAAARARWG